MTITVAIATRLRPKGLNRLLRALQEIQEPISEVNIVVVDNDPEGSAHVVVEKVATISRWPIRYVHEERQGIPFARNAALKSVEGSEFLAFIDDDETPSSNWLVHFEQLMRNFPSADVIAGPVTGLLPPDTPEWVRNNPMFKESVMGPIEPRRTAASGNVFIRLKSIERWGLKFDERFPLLGGEDTDFFKRLAEKGGQILFDPSAKITEHIPVERTALRWVLRRGYSSGYSPAVRSIADKSIKGRISEIPKVVYRIARGLLLTVSALWGGRQALLRAGIQFASAAGSVTAIAGIGFDEYKNVDGE